jgi:hypothetical protein
MLENVFKKWQLVLLGVIMVASVRTVLAQSSSASYQAVDFVNPSASLSTSGSYQLNDSIDYYGGIHSSSGYTECTGDFAVLSDCGQLVTPPPPPPPPPGGGGGGSGCFSGCSGSGHVDTFGNPPSEGEEDEENPVVEPPVDTVKPKKPFVLPNIKEPLPLVEKPVLQVKPVIIQEEKPSVREIVKLIEDVETKVVELVASKLNCEDLVCLQTNLLRPAAKNSFGETCKVYAFGGFGFVVDCQLLVLLWMVVGLSGLFVIPLGIKRYRKN